MFMHWLFCYVMEKSFEIPILPFATKIERELEKEIDFSIEAENAETCKRNFTITNRHDVYIPTIYHDYTSKRTLVMEYMGIHLKHS